ncbi:MAG: DUF3817 domain-containing protein [Bacteroidota bacterium]|nr:DUF3817 domain-containing protein [Bacteroidota bacterium]
MTSRPWYTSAKGRFHVIAIAEGISFLVLLGIAMPLKYFAGLPQAVLMVGWIHGLLFVLYVIALCNVRSVHHWNFKKFFLAGLASLIPFGPFIMDKKLLRDKEL